MENLKASVHRTSTTRKASNQSLFTWPVWQLGKTTCVNVYANYCGNRPLRWEFYYKKLLVFGLFLFLFCFLFVFVCFVFCFAFLFCFVLVFLFFVSCFFLFFFWSGFFCVCVCFFAFYFYFFFKVLYIGHRCNWNWYRMCILMRKLHLPILCLVFFPQKRFCCQKTPLTYLIVHLWQAIHKICQITESFI